LRLLSEILVWKKLFAEQSKAALCAAFFSKNEGEENETTAADST